MSDPIPMFPFPDVIRWRADGGEVWLNGTSGEVEYRPNRNSRPGAALTVGEVESVWRAMAAALAFWHQVTDDQAVTFTNPSPPPF